MNALIYVMFTAILIMLIAVGIICWEMSKMHEPEERVNDEKD